MKGMTPSPSPVVAHFLVFSATEGRALASPTREPAQIRLMRKPDIKSEFYTLSVSLL